MDYGQLIKEAWSTTWRYRFLWVLGLFAGGAAGLSGFQGNWRGSSGDTRDAPPALRAFADSALLWAEANAGLIAVAALLLVVLALAFVVLSLIAQGAMAEATADIAIGKQVTLGSAWRTGLHLFWRYLGMWLLLIGVSALVAAAVAAGIALVAAVAMLGGGAGTVIAAIVAIVVGLPLAVAAIAAGVALSIVVTYAQRAIAVEDDGAWAALRDGWRVLRAHLVESLLVWLINVALGIATGLVLLVGVLVALAVLGGVGAAVWSLAGLAAPTFAYAALAGLVFLALLMLAGAVANTFFWSYWTLAYLRLTGRAGAAAPA